MDIINKKNAFIAAAAVLLLCAFMVLMIGIVTIGKGCEERDFTIKTMEDGSKTIVSIVDDKEVIPKNAENISVDGESISLWYNAKDNIIVENYYFQTWGCVITGVVLALIGSLILVNGFKKKALTS